MTIKKIAHLCSTLALALSAAATQAANYAGNTFEIEMIVFERPQGMAQTSENWPAEPKLSYPGRWVDFNTRTHRKETSKSPAAPTLSEPNGSTHGPRRTTDLDEEPIGFETMGLNGNTTDETPLSRLMLSPVATKLDNKVAALVRGGDRILFHKAWHQVLEQKHKSPAILIDGGDAYAGHNQLEGSITLSVSRYLHLSTNLWLSDFSAPASTKGIRLPLRPKVTPTASIEETSTRLAHEGNNSFSNQEPQDALSPAARQEPMTLDASLPVAEQPMHVMRAAHLQHERRMRSGQLHYIDHPAFGILIEIRTVAGIKEEPTEEINSDTL
ncbi:CsiV family protein [Microbulbifer sp. THAF38]|uniref:CsiV family protein n=1 Tax=Microbulbifer sp. THAF38 TaxID=2587856 RepID=UPI00156232C8|nr:CsiV family protein [Microbulbifer sp. THAF38]